MKMKLGVIVFIFIVLVLGSPVQAAFTYDPSLTWRTLHTDHFNIHFHNGEEKLAHQTAAIAEQVYKQLTVYFHWTPIEPTSVVLTDRDDFSNGSASPFPNNQMILIMTPPDDLNTLEDVDNWLETLITHEYTHIIHLDKASGTPGALRGAFGRLYPWLFPNTLQPSWNIEGLATFMETDFERGIGRGQSSSFQMLMRLEVENGIKPLREVNQPLVSWPSGTTRYLYGVYFYQFIAERYGKDKIAQLIDDYSTHVIPFMLSTNSMHVLGKNMDQLWNEFEDYLNKTFKPEIAEIKAQGVRAGEQLTNTGYYTERPRALPNGDIFFLQNDFKSHAKLMRYDHDTNIAQKVVNVNPGARFDLHPQAGILLVQLELYKNVNTFSDLYQVDIHTNKKVRLTKGARYRAATWSPDGKSIIAVRNDLGNCSLHLLTNTGKYVETLWQGTNKDVVTELDWSPNGKELVAAVWRPDGQWNLESFSLKDRSWKKLTNTKQIEGQPQYNSNGTSIVFAADYQGIFNIRTLDLTSGKTSTLTNVIGGGFNPSLSQNGNTLYYTGAGPSGFNVFKLKLDNLPVSSPVPDASGMTSSSDPMVVKQTSSDPTHVSGTITPYTPYDSLSPTWWFPYFLFTPHRDELGFMTSGSDALNRHNFSLLAAYDIKNHWPTGELDYIYDRWYPALKFRAARSSSELLTNGDNLERIRSSDSLTAEAVFPFMKFNYQWGFHIAAVYDIESDRQVAQNYIAIPDRTDTLGGIALTFNSANRYPIAISKSDGRMIKFVYEKSDLFGGNYDGNIYSVDWKEYIKLGKENVLALRLAGGLGTQTSRPFQLGGSFSEELPDLLTIPTDVIFNKRQYALRGYPQGLAGLTGRRMLLGAVEWRFPIKLVEYGVTAPVPIGIHQIYGDVFYNAGEAWFETEPHKPVHSGVGLELNTETVLGYWIVLNLRLGFAHGFDQGGTNQVYLTIGSSF